MSNQIKLPISDRGVQNTSGLILLEKIVLIDWFEFTIHNKISPTFIFTDYLHLSLDDIVSEEVGLYCYNYTFSFRDIKILINTNNYNFGIHVLMSGKGCRDFESLGFDWLDFMNFLSDNFDVHYSRVDIAIDSFNDRFYNLSKIRDYIKNGQVVSRFKSSTEFIQKSLSSSDIESETIWFGSRTSNIQIVFYNKLFERLNSNYVLSDEFKDIIKSWYRCEIRFRNDHANTLIDCFISNNNYMNVINQVLFNYLDFKDYNSSESNRSRWNTSQWWLDFLDTNSKLSLSCNKKYSDIVRKKKWLSNSCSKSELLVFLSEIAKDNDYSLDSYSSNFLLDLLKKGYKNFSVKDLSLINEYRVQNNLNLLTYDDIIDLFNSLYKFILK